MARASEMQNGLKETRVKFGFDDGPSNRHDKPYFADPNSFMRID